MAPKKVKKQSSNEADSSFVVLHDEKSSRHVVLAREKLVNCNTENLKIGSSATFNGDGDRSARFRGTVIIIGTKGQCEKSIAMIEKSNNSGRNLVEKDMTSKKNAKNSDNDSDEHELESSNHFTIDEQTEDEEDHRKEEQVKKKDVVPNAVHSSQAVNGVKGSKRTSTMSSITIEPDVASSSTIVPPASTLYGNKIIDENNNIISHNPKRKEIIDENSNVISHNQKRKQISDESTSVTKKIKGSNGITRAMYDDLKRENKKLRKEVHIYKTNWMYKPPPAAAKYFIDVGKLLSGSNLDNDDRDKGDILEDILTTLEMDEKELQSCEHATDITKTCRHIVKRKYRNDKNMSSMRVALMDEKTIGAIRRYARLVHPVQANILDSTLNNAIGNVFATEKRKQERKEAFLRRRANQLNDDEEEEDDDFQEEDDSDDDNLNEDT